MAFRYASGNTAGGGPFSLEIDNQAVTSNITVPSTSSNSWNVWATKTVNDIPLSAGNHILKIKFSAGEFNLGKLTFAGTGNLAFSVPTANAGNDIKVVLPQNTTTLDGSGSTESAGKTLSYEWTQIYGPTVAVLYLIHILRNLLLAI
jgi:hypothetical protein